MGRKQLTVPSRSCARVVIKRQIIIVAYIASLYLQFAVAFVRTVRSHQCENTREKKKEREREKRKLAMRLATKAIKLRAREYSRGRDAVLRDY